MEPVGKRRVDLIGPWRFQVKIPHTRMMWLVGQQVKAFHRASSATNVGNAVAGIVTATIAALSSHFLAAAMIIIAIGYAAGSRQLRARQYVTQPHSKEMDRAELAWILRHGSISGLIWGTANFCMMLSAEGPQLQALMLLLPLTILTGSLATDMVFLAAVRFIILAAIGLCAGLLLRGTPETIVSAFVIVVYALAFLWLAKLSASGFAIRNLRTKEAKEAADTIHLLLNDYEEHSADWLWETDAQKCIVRPSTRFRDAAGRQRVPFVGAPLIDLFEAGHDRDILELLIEKGQSFRDVIVSLIVGDDRKWWSVSGRAICNDQGKLLGMRGVATDVSAAKLAEAKIAHLAQYDGLTDLPNRMLFHETLARALAKHEDQALLAVLYLDLDHFKSINDTLGHAAGDQVLKIAATRINSCLGRHDLVARMGGDEFAILLPEIKQHEAAESVAKAIIHAMAEPIFLDGQQVNTGASIGMTFASEDGNEALDLIKNADMALYHSKQNGRSQFSRFEIGMHQALQARRKIEMDLRVAISRDELELYYQPLVNLKTGETSGYEALLRWNHPEDGMVMPGTFIPVAEETGLIVQLGEWVIRNALMEVARWPDHLSVSVNLSPAQMRSPNLLPTVIHALAASGVPANRLEMEITETVLMQDSEANLTVLHQLRSLGVRIALDDFGTGYSSLNYLRSFPFDKIKIDRCFVDDVDSRDDSRAIIRAVTGLAQSLGMVTTAEGVEREDQLEHLRGEGCTEVQGYYFAKPLPARNVVGRVMEVDAVVPAPTPKRSVSKAA